MYLRNILFTPQLFPSQEISYGEYWRRPDLLHRARRRRMHSPQQLLRHQQWRSNLVYKPCPLHITLGSASNRFNTNNDGRISSTELASYYGDLPKALEHFIECQYWQKAHSIFITSVAHSLYLSVNDAEVWRLATSMEEHKSEIDDWDLGAGIYVSFYVLRSDMKDDGGTNKPVSLEDRDVSCDKLQKSLAILDSKLPRYKIVRSCWFRSAIATATQFIENFEERTYKSMIIPLMQEDKRAGEATRKGFYLYGEKHKARPDPEIKTFIGKTREISGVNIDPKVGEWSKKYGEFFKPCAHMAEKAANGLPLSFGYSENDYAYTVDRDVYFSVDKSPSYGRLSGRKLEDNRAGEHVAVDSRKHNPSDFALWKMIRTPFSSFKKCCYSYILDANFRYSFAANQVNQVGKAHVDLEDLGGIYECSLLKPLI
ncbi:LOW QUALITY PROTEIN: hypothetical protein V2J09_012689 [Rumex salicifolius]